MAVKEVSTNALAKTILSLALDDVDARFAIVEDDDAFPFEVLLHVLSEQEKARAAQFDHPDESRHFVFRRCFQRLFVAQLVRWQGPASTVPLVHQLDQPPRCNENPDMRLSFSSSNKTYLMAASDTLDIGVDIEQIRTVPDAEALAYRFMSPEEAGSVAALDEPARSRHFLTLWSGKEAGLKALGRGVESGLNTFTFSSTQANYSVHQTGEPLKKSRWRMALPAWSPHFIIAVLHRPAQT
jgi:phosphopantetheinyl transferase